MYKYIKNKKGQGGFGMAEAVIAVSILSSFIIVVAGVNILYLNLSLGNKQPLSSSIMLEEAIEAVRFMRDGSWKDNILPLSVGTPYYLNYSSGWNLSTTPVQNGIFTRTVTFGEVERDVNGAIVASLGTVDPDTRLVTVNVSWQGKSGATSRNMKTYITNLFSN
ncbi:MAG: hypothetical protein AAB392_00850 [Patescibacteria group bacterium]